MPAASPSPSSVFPQDRTRSRSSWQTRTISPLTKPSSNSRSRRGMQRAATTDRSSSPLDESSSSNRIGEKSMFEEINPHRRRFFGTVATAFAAAQLGLIGFANAQSGTAKPLPAIKPGTNTSFGTLKQIDAGVLNICYAEAGAPDGSPVILLHGGLMTFTAMSMSRLCWHLRV